LQPCAPRRALRQRLKPNGGSLAGLLYGGYFLIYAKYALIALFKIKCYYKRENFKRGDFL
jgi:hypothetical protein